ncbi:hypothetical protein [uncultured Chitinophaga sp.]|uniref:hypothetical protein n=1 Tax=uncultured Chitinophaga sp. TaxID=339340 RepID=UPI0026094A95|nr:hypothetical protein [uncultured Chitinophaga sp.]
MEKINALIDRLQELKNSNADLQTISYYAQLLQVEVLHARTLQKAQDQSQKSSQSTIAVIMPSQAAQTVSAAAATNGAHHHNGHTNSNHLDTATVAPEKRSIPAPERIQPEPVQVAPPPPPPPPPPAPSPAPVQERKPVTATLFDVEKPAPAPRAKEANGLRREINELVSQKSTSLNDRLKQSITEVADRLGDMPVKDLKQAIGINDKFQFIQELFRGDVDMYERSIKTINECHTLQEAEYWIERELKIRQGWLDDTRPVQHFYSLVKKRFS